uniref:Reverse transcriptase domain-containing protein n=1 Tax=Globodera pallida TaxID=36090 RepID=A0A183BRP0_GLOPA
MELNGEDFGIITNESKQLNLTNALANFRQFGGEFQRALTLGAFMDNYRIASGLIAMEIFLSANKNGTKRCKTQMPPSPPVFKGWNLLNSSEQRPECARVFLNDSNYTAQIGKRRLTFEDPVWLEMDCANGIRKRNYFPGKEGFEDAAFPLAQVRIVYKKQFRMRLNQLSECLPNVVVSTREWVIAGGGHNMTRAFLDCLNLLTVPEKQWEYVALLQVRRAGGRTKQRMNDRIKNHDVAIKTNREMVQIYRWLNGANDVEVITVLNASVAGTGLAGTGLDRPGRGWRDGTGMADGTGREDGAGRDGARLAGTGRGWTGRDGAGWPERDFDYPIEVTLLPGGRVNESLDWSFEAIRMFRNESRNVLDVEGFPPKLVLSKGYVASSLSRKMAEFMLYELDLTETVRRLESGVNFGIDEILMPTLHAADALRAPGGAAIWYDVKKCGSGHMRHAVCLFGMEDLADKMAVWPHLFANKLMPEFDFGALLCWWEKMHQRAYIETRQRSLSRLNSAFYADLPHVRFQKFAADLKKLNDAQRGTKDIIPFRKALAFFNCSTDKFNVN